LNWKVVLNIVKVLLIAIWTFRSIQIVKVQRKLMSTLCTVIKTCALLNVLLWRQNRLLQVPLHAS